MHLVSLTTRLFLFCEVCCIFFSNSLLFYYVPIDKRWSEDMF